MSNVIANRNLLFGILALQRNLITRDAFVTAMNVWPRDKDKGVGQILREQNALSDNHYTVLEAVVDILLEKHGNDAQKCLADVSWVGSIKQDLEKIADPDVQASLAFVARAAVAAPTPGPAAAAIMATLVQPGPATQPAPADKTAEPRRKLKKKASGAPTWALLGCGVAMGVAAVGVAVSAVLFVLLAFVMMPHKDNGHVKVKPAAVPIIIKEEPIKPAGDVVKKELPPKQEPAPRVKDPDPPIVVKPPMKDPDPPIVVKPPMKDPDPPVVIKPPPVVKPENGATPLIVELPRPASRACLTADGQYVAYALTVGKFGYRAGPNFNLPRVVVCQGTQTTVTPLASSPDGRKMALSAGTTDGPRIFIWDWTTMQLETTLVSTNLAVSSVFSPDGKYLATYTIRPILGEPTQYWLHVHDMTTWKSPVQLHGEVEPTFFGFTPDSATVFYAAKGNPTVRAVKIAMREDTSVPFIQISKKHFFARDFSKFAYIDAPDTLQLAYVKGLRGIGKLDAKILTSHFHAAAFSAGSRYILIATENTDKRPDLVGRVMLVDVFNGKTLSLTEPLDGIPNKVELGANGVGLVQGTTLKPRLYRFPVPAGEVLIKDDPPFLPPEEGFVSLFNGKDLTGWRQHKLFDGDWRVDKGVLTASFSPRGIGCLQTERPQPKDFHLRIEARVGEPGSASVFFRGQPDGNLAGYEAMIRTVNNQPGRTRVGGLGVQVPGRGTSFGGGIGRSIPVGQWFTLEIIAEGNHLITKVDGQIAADFRESSILTAGHIILAQLNKSKVEFRRIEIKELKAAAEPPNVATPGFEQLFNGKDLTGWRPHSQMPGEWRVVNDLLTGDPAQNSYLFTKRDDFEDFHLRLVARRKNAEGSGVMVRYLLDFQGYEIGLTDRTLGLVSVRTKTGLGQDKRDVRMAPGVAANVPLGDWFTMEIIAEGNRLRVKVDGRTTTDFVDTEFRAGRLALRDLKQALEIRRIEIKETKLEVAPPQAVALKDLVPLFNGKNLDGWRFEGNGGWKVSPAGELLGQGPETGILTKRDDFKDFTARIELSASADVDAFFGFRQNAGPDGKWLGLTTRLVGNGENVSAGFIGFDSSKTESGRQQLKFKPGETFTLEVRVTQSSVRIVTNDKDTADFNFTKKYAGPGAIGLFIANGSVRVSKFEIKEDAAPMVAPPPVVAAVGEFAPLFNGKDLTGWQPHAKKPGNWNVAGGILIGNAPAGGSLYTTRGDFKDFHLRAEARINDQGFGRVFVRAAYDPTKLPIKVLGYEAFINQRPLGAKTGAVTARSFLKTMSVAAKESQAKAGEWFTLEIIAKGEAVTVMVNGATVAAFQDDRSQYARDGHIALHQDANGLLEFRKVEVKELAPAP